MQTSRLARCVPALATAAIILAATLGAILLYVPKTAKAEFPFSHNVRVNTDTGSGSQETPVIAVDTSGNPYVAWTDDRNGDYDIYFARSTDGGSTWTDPNVRVNSDPAGPTQSEPSIAVDSGGNVYAVWADDRNGNSDIYFARSTNGGTTWTNPNVRINTDAGSAIQHEPCIAVDGSGVIYVAWTDERNTSAWMDIYFARSTDGGFTWSDPNIRVNSAGGLWSKERPSIALASNNRVFVAWMDWRNSATTNFDMYFGASFDGGLTWPGPDVQVNSDTINNIQRSPSLATDTTGRAHVVWEDYRNGGYDIYIASSGDNGTTWTDPNVMVNTVDYWELDADVATDLAGNVYVAWWTTGSMRSDDIMLGISHDGGATFSGPDYRADDASGAQWYPRIAVDSGGSVMLVWQDSRNPSWDIYFATLSSLAAYPKVEGFGPSTPGIEHIIPHLPLFNFTYYSFMARPMAQYEVSVWDETSTTQLWTCPVTPLTPLPSWSNVSVRYNSAPCPSGGPQLLDGTTYKLWIIVVDVGGGGAPATILDFHMNEILNPQPPVDPADDAAVVCSTSFRVWWTSPGQDAEGDYPQSYLWQVASDPSFTTTVTSGSTTGTGSTWFDTCPSGQFYWRVNTTDGWERSAYGNQPDGYWNFTSYTPNTAPVASSVRADNYTSGSTEILHMLNHMPVFSWSYYDENSDPQTAFEVRVGTYSGYDNMWAPGQVSSSAKDVTYAGSSLQDGYSYYVGVRVFDSEDWSSWVTTRFHMNAPPGTANPYNPYNSSSNVAVGTVTLRWYSASDTEGDAVSYHWYVSDRADFSNIVAGGQTTGTSATFTTVAGRTYYWRVQTSDPYELGPFSTVYHFSTAPPPPDTTMVMSVVVLLVILAIAVAVVIPLLIFMLYRRAKKQQQMEAWRLQLEQQQQMQQQQQGKPS